jgi:hypothetical protein
MRTYDESKPVLGTVWPGCWYLVDGLPVRPSVNMDASEWRRLGCQRITYCDVYGRGVISSPEMKNDEIEE